MRQAISRHLPDILFWFFALFVFSSTFSIALSQSALGISAVLFLIIAYREKHQPFMPSLRWFYLVVAVYIGWLIFTSVMGGTLEKSLNNMREEWLFMIIPIGLYLLALRKNLDRLLGGLAGGMILVTLYSLSIYVGRTFLDWDIGRQMITEGAPRLMGNFSHPLTFGNYMVTGGLFLLALVMVDNDRFSRGWRWFLLGGGLAGIVGTMLSNSRGPTVVLLIGLVILLLFLRRRRLLFVMVLLVTVGLVMLSMQNIRTRFETTDNRSGIERHWHTYWQGSRLFIWKNSLKIIEAHPLVGVGPGNFDTAYATVVGPKLHPQHRYGHAHNDFLHIAAQTGIPGAVIFGLLWLTALGYFWRGYRRVGPGTLERQVSAAALIGSLLFLGTSMTEATMADEEVRALLMFIWAVGLSPWYKTKTGESSSVRPDA